MVEQFYQSDCFSMNPTTVLSQRVGKEKESATKPFIGVKTMPFISGCSSNTQRNFFFMKILVDCHQLQQTTSSPRVPRLLRLSPPTLTAVQQKWKQYCNPVLRIAPISPNRHVTILYHSRLSQILTHLRRRSYFTADVYAILSANQISLHEPIWPCEYV